MESISSSNPPAEQVTQIILPDLVGYCSFPLRSNPHYAALSTISDEWLIRLGQLNPKQIKSLRGRNLALVTALCYPEATSEKLRVTCDFMNYLLHTDDLTDDMDVPEVLATGDLVISTLRDSGVGESKAPIAELTRDLWTRIIQTASDGCKHRFISTYRQFFAAVARQSSDRHAGVTLDLQSYIETRRNTGGVMTCFAMIEYANDLDLPSEVMENHTIKILEECSNDWVNWSNDLWSYNKEQAVGDTHNLVCVIMRQYSVDLQSAIDIVGSMCKDLLDRFAAERARLPRWGPQIDAQVDVYVDGLADWIVGSMHFSFASKRYFGDCGPEVMRTRIVQLRPRRSVEN